MTWFEIHVWVYESACVSELEGDERLAALYRWKTGAPVRYAWFMNGTEEIACTGDIDWTLFPEARASRVALLWSDH